MTNHEENDDGLPRYIGLARLNGIHYHLLLMNSAARLKAFGPKDIGRIVTLTFTPFSCQLARSIHIALG